MHGYPGTWIIVGLFYPPKEKIPAQGRLFWGLAFFLGFRVAGSAGSWPVAIRMTWTALPMTSAGRFAPF